MVNAFLLALAAAVYPQLLAVVVLILTRPKPKRLLWACYLGCLLVSVAGGILIFVIFRSRGSIAGTGPRRVGPEVYLVIGGIALVLAIVFATQRGRELMGRDLPVLRRRKHHAPDESRVGRMRSRAELALKEGSLVVAGVVGAVLAVPGPFDVIALGHLARGGYPATVAGATIVAFALIKFLLIEIPILGYAIDPDGTAATVSQFSHWMQANKFALIAVIVGVIGIVLIGRGVSALG